MKTCFIQARKLSVCLMLLGLPVLTAQAQQRGPSDRVGSAPANGEALPDVAVSLSDGTPLSTSQMKGSYTVLVFGCLT